MSNFMLTLWTNIVNVLVSVRDWLTANPARVRVALILIVAALLVGLLFVPEAIVKAGQASGGS